MPPSLEYIEPVVLERMSIEVTNACAKACSFCYSKSTPAGTTSWTPDEIVSFAEDCARNGVKAVSLGGGEPLEYPGLLGVLARLQGTLFRSVTTSGLRLAQGDVLEQLVEARPDKVHVSIHYPQRDGEVARVTRQVIELEERGIRAGVNLVVARSSLQAAAEAAGRLRSAGIGNDRIIYLPMRIRDTPSPDEMGRVAGSSSFQSMSCLLACGASPRFASIAHDKTVAWCSYTVARQRLAELSYRGLSAALEPLGLTFCGGTDGE